MNELISYGNSCPTVIGRKLHADLEIRATYSNRPNQMYDYRFEEERNYGTGFSNLGSSLRGG